MKHRSRVLSAFLAVHAIRGCGGSEERPIPAATSDATGSENDAKDGSAIAARDLERVALLDVLGRISGTREPPGVDRSESRLEIGAGPHGGRGHEGPCTC